jgi:hypothetical protein
MYALTILESPHLLGRSLAQVLLLMLLFCLGAGVSGSVPAAEAADSGAQSLPPGLNHHQIVMPSNSTQSSLFVSRLRSRGA